jgi:hypothetical protein
VKSLFAQEIESVLSEEQTSVLLLIPEKIGLTAFLIEHPLNILRFENKVLYLGHEVSGIYDFQKKKLLLGLQRTVQSTVELTLNKSFEVSAL